MRISVLRSDVCLSYLGDQGPEQGLDLGALIGQRADGGAEVVDQLTELGVALVEDAGDAVERRRGVEERSVDGGERVTQLGHRADRGVDALTPAVEDGGAVGDQATHGVGVQPELGRASCRERGGQYV